MCVEHLFIMYLCIPSRREEKPCEMDRAAETAGSVWC